MSEVKLEGKLVGRLGVRLAPSKIDYVTQLAQPHTVEEVRALLRACGHLRLFMIAYGVIKWPRPDD